MDERNNQLRNSTTGEKNATTNVCIDERQHASLRAVSSSVECEDSMYDVSIWRNFKPCCQPIVPQHSDTHFKRISMHACTHTHTHTSVRTRTSAHIIGWSSWSRSRCSQLKCECECELIYRLILFTNCTWAARMAHNNYLSSLASVGRWPLAVWPLSAPLQTLAGLVCAFVHSISATTLSVLCASVVALSWVGGGVRVLLAFLPSGEFMCFMCMK